MISGHDRVEYRVGVFEGHRDSLPTNPLRWAARVQLQLLDPEPKSPFRQGGYLTPNKVLAVAAFGEVQSHYEAYTLEAFFSYPVTAGAQLTVQANTIVYDGDTTFPALRDQRTYAAEGGLYVTRVKLMPFARYETQRLEGTVNDGFDVDR